MTGNQLKNTILQEAIEGRLVPQDPNDEPASVLLDKIRKEKARLVKEGKLKKKDLEETPISEDEKPFDIPDSWEWVRLSEITSYRRGSFPQPYTDLTSYGGPNSMPFVQVADVDEVSYRLKNETKKTISQKAMPFSVFAPKGTVVVTLQGSIGKVAITQYDSYVDRTLAIFHHIYGQIDKMFFSIVLKNKFENEALYARGATIKTITKEEFQSFVLPLPPLAEQKRIVAKIEELLPKVEAYGKAQESLDKLNEELPERLKKSILQEAIEGRLVPQDPNDEPASVLLEKIRKEKARLVKEGKLKKKDLEETPISEDEKPFDIPKHWGLVRLGEITYNHGQKTPTEDFSYIDIGSIDNEHQKLNMTDNIIKAKDAPFRARKIVKRGDVLYATVRPYLHNLCIIDRDFDKEPIASTGFAVLSCINGVYNKFLFYYLLSPVFDAYANDGDNAKGMAYPAINDKKLYNGLVPLPPLAEQHRIVAKIEQLMKEIDKLKV